VAYFTAVLARVGSSWKARDVEVSDAVTLDDLADALRAVAVDDQPVLAVVEHEDDWFALVRVDGEDDPRVFVSDLFAASRSSYGEVLAPAAETDPGSDDEDADDEDGEDVKAPAVTAWAGETDLLDDLGVSGRSLRRLVEDQGDDPGSVLAEVGDTVGFGEMLEALR